MDSPLLVDIELDVGIMSVDSPPLVEDSHAFARTPLVDVARERMSALWENRTSVKAFLKTILDMNDPHLAQHAISWFPAVYEDSFAVRYFVQECTRRRWNRVCGNVIHKLSGDPPSKYYFDWMLTTAAASQNQVVVDLVAPFCSRLGRVKAMMLASKSDQLPIIKVLHRFVKENPAVVGVAVEAVRNLSHLVWTYLVPSTIRVSNAQLFLNAAASSGNLLFLAQFAKKYIETASTALSIAVMRENIDCIEMLNAVSSLKSRLQALQWAAQPQHKNYKAISVIVSQNLSKCVVSDFCRNSNFEKIWPSVLLDILDKKQFKCLQTMGTLGEFDKLRFILTRANPVQVKLLIMWTHAVHHTEFRKILCKLSETKELYRMTTLTRAALVKHIVHDLSNTELLNVLEAASTDGYTDLMKAVVNKLVTIQLNSELMISPSAVVPV